MATFKSPTVRIIKLLLMSLATLSAPAILIEQGRTQTVCTSSNLDSQISKLAAKGSEKDTALQTLSQCGETAISRLIQTMQQNSSLEVKLASVNALVKIGKPSVEPLSQTLNNASEAVETRSLAIDALTRIAQANPATTVGITQTLTERRLDEKENSLIRVSAARALETIGTPTQPALSEQLKEWTGKNPKVAIGLATVAGFGLLYLLALSFKPRSLLLLPEKLTIPGTKVELPLGLLRWLKYQPRVLDRWVADHLLQVQSRFLEKPTVSEREIHIPIQIKLGSEVIEQLSPQQLQPIFRRSSATLLIWGEGGVGKTSLTCQIARWGMGLGDQPGSKLASHRMVPVLIEQELENNTLLTAIREQLPRTPEGNFISDQLLEALLRRQRVLVILDHVSEMKDHTYQQMQETLNNTPINALIITSRLSTKDLGRPDKTLLEPQKIEGARLSTFIQPYLERQGKRNLFEDDAEFYRTCTRLSSMMAATLQTATALLVRLYVDQVIDAGGLKTAQLPENIPELMLQYLCWLNRPEAVAKEVRREDDEIHRDAKVVAWKCLEETYRPAAARYSDVIQVLETVNPEAARLRLNYLADRLRLVKIEADRVRIMLDPVAEYLAAFYVVQHNQREEAAKRWQYFFDRLDADPDNLPTVRGFLLAVRNCAEREGKKLPAGVLEGLNQRANLNPKEMAQAERRQRINRQIDNLYDGSSKIVSQAIRNLQSEGHQATRAIPDLLKMVRSQAIEPALRIEALGALMQIHSDRAALDQVCQELLSHRNDDAPEVRVAAIEHLMQVCQQAEDLPALLRRYFEDGSEQGIVRVRAGEGLRQLGLLSQLLVVEVDAQANPTIHLLEPPETQTIELAEGVELTLVRIPAGNFWMGSLAGEGFDDEHPQHQVMVPEFWMGQTPVTQAQYEAVIGRNPATFRTNFTNPVETVSWYDAVAFCQRLSELTDREFRLPTEAEWEYACRASPIQTSGTPGSEEVRGAGTTPPFHFGLTITTDLANYRGTDWDYGGQIYPGNYGEGPKGSFREETTPVGSFPPNAYGLYDMHGNVWEWCADHWHDNYSDKPESLKANGDRPWLSDNENSYRLVRGGSWFNTPQNCRSAYRDYDTPGGRSYHFGFRLVCSAART